jgi:hypothetical protein
LSPFSNFSTFQICFFCMWMWIACWSWLSYYLFVIKLGVCMLILEGGKQWKCT